jgi:hypothetical protein
MLIFENPRYRRKPKESIYRLTSAASHLKIPRIPILLPHLRDWRADLTK